MLSSLKKAWRRLVGEDAPQLTRQEADGVFHLLLGAVRVGTLRYERGVWQFAYTEEFKRRTDLRPLAQFPDRDAPYESDELWPFFAMRIPSMKQPVIQAAVARENIDQTDRVQLLRRFGRRTVANPYELVEVVG